MTIADDPEPSPGAWTLIQASATEKAGSLRENLDNLDSAVTVFDLPQLYTKPSAGDLLTTLDRLAVRPRTFSHSDGDAERSQLVITGASQYLTSIIASGLAWLESDDVREAIWEAASARLCERSGRSAMPSISRVFTVPDGDGKPFSVTLHEPSLTADNLGMKTWVSSYLLAKRLHTLRDSPSFPAFPRRTPLRALELGAGTGLVGISFAALWGSAASIHLTDLDPIVPNLEHNVGLNEDLLNTSSAAVSTGLLDWSLENGPASNIEPRYDIILAADPLYSPEHPRWLVQTIERRLDRDTHSRVVLEMPLRDAYLPQVTDFKQRMKQVGLRVVEEGEEVGYDDWESRDGASLEVRCWWSVWTWDALRLKKLDDG